MSTCLDQELKFKTHYIAEGEYSKGISFNDSRKFLNSTKIVQESIGAINQANLSLKNIINSLRDYHFYGDTDEVGLGYLPVVGYDQGGARVWCEISLSDGDYTGNAFFSGEAYIKNQDIVSRATVLTAVVSGGLVYLELSNALNTTFLDILNQAVRISSNDINSSTRVSSMSGVSIIENRLPTLEIIGDSEITVQAGYGGTLGFTLEQNGVTKRAQWIKTFWMPEDGVSTYTHNYRRHYNPPISLVHSSGYSENRYNQFMPYTAEFALDRAWGPSMWVDDSGNGTYGTIYVGPDVNPHRGFGKRGSSFFLLDPEKDQNTVGFWGNWSRVGNDLHVNFVETYLGTYAIIGHMSVIFSTMCWSQRYGWYSWQQGDTCNQIIPDFFINRDAPFKYNSFSPISTYAYRMPYGHPPWGGISMVLKETDVNGNAVNLPCSWWDDIHGDICAAGNYVDEGAIAYDPEEGDITHRIRIVITKDNPIPDNVNSFQSYDSNFVDFIGWHETSGGVSFLDENGGYDVPDGYRHANPFETGIDLNEPGTYYIHYEVSDQCWFDDVPNGKQIIRKVRKVNVVR